MLLRTAYNRTVIHTCTDVAGQILPLVCYLKMLGKPKLQIIQDARIDPAAGCSRLELQVKSIASVTGYKALRAG
jgi:hypothetical protein